jgi:hypothetical protein
LAAPLFVSVEIAQEIASMASGAPLMVIPLRTAIDPPVLSIGPVVEAETI